VIPCYLGKSGRNGEWADCQKLTKSAVERGRGRVGSSFQVSELQIICTL
jgi:hypothetical protein